MPKSDRRVVVTGIGIISPLGINCDQFWQNIASGKSGVEVLDRVPSPPLQTNIAAEAKEFAGVIDEFGELEKSLKRSIKRGLKLMCREIRMGVAAAQLALGNANIAPGQLDPTRIGTMFGSDYIITQPFEFSRGVGKCLDESRQFDFGQWAENGLTQVEPLWLLKYLPNMPASHVAIFNDLQGPSNSLTVREASANLAVSEAMTIIQRGNADVMVAGSTGSRIHPLRTVHVAMQEQLAPNNGDPSKASRPFDTDRNGMVMGEGAGVLILEEAEHAAQRGAQPLAEVLGYGSSSVANRQGVADYKTGIANVLKMSLETSGLQPADIGHIHAHGLSTINCDAQEAAAINEVFGESTPVTTAKSYMGNLGAGSGIVEIVASLKSLEHNQVFPSLNLDNLDSNCPINAISETIDAPSEVFLNVNITPQGQASAVILRSLPTS
jgi:3-oxoacyl-[acyl-carrier-protein] synthase II